MSRKDLYAKVKQLDIAEAIKSAYGDNYTRVSNADLEAFINKTEASKKVKKSPAKNISTKGEKAAFIKLLSILQARKIVSAKEAEEVVMLL